MTTLNTAPRLTGADSPYRRSIYAKLGTELPLRHLGVAPNPMHIISRQLGATCPLSIVKPPTLNSLGDILSVSPQMKMGRLDADGPVTGMQHVKSRRYVAAVNPIGSDVCRNVPRSHAEPAIAIRVGVPRPVPASLSGWITGHIESERRSFGEPSASQSWPSFWVTIFTPSAVMRFAQPLGTSWIITHHTRHLSTLHETGN